MLTSSRWSAWWATCLCCGSLLAGADAWARAAAEDAANPKPATSTRKKPRVAETATTTLNAAGWEKLFDGKTLYGWKSTEFVGRSEVEVDNGKIVMRVGEDMTGITYTNEVPRMNYEVYLEAMRMDGSDFFCGLTFPVDKEPCSLIVGGWGGGLVGLSSIEGSDAANNETTRYKAFDNNRWYRIRLRVTPGHIEAWIEDEKLVDVALEGRSLGIRIEVERSKPFGIATWRTTGAIRDIRWRKLEPAEAGTPAPENAKEKK